MKYAPQAIDTVAISASSYSEMEIHDLEGGGWIVSWQCTVYPDYGIHVQRYDEDGNKVGEDVNLGVADDHQLMMLSDGGWLLRGTDFSAYPSTAATWRFDANGARVDLPEESAKPFHSVAALASGGWIGTWTVFAESGEQSILVQHYGEDGEAIGISTVVAFSTASSLGKSEVIAVDGGWLVTWSEYLPNDTSNVFQQRYATDGSALGDPEQLNSDPASSYRTPKTTMLEDGGWITSWQGSEIFMQRFSAAGEKVGDVIGIEKPARSGWWQQWDITGLSNGGWVVTWKQTDEVNTESVTNLRAQVYDADGDASGRQIVVVEGGYTRIPSVVALDDGAFVVSWGEDFWAANTQVKQRIFRTVDNTDPVAVDDVAQMVEGTKQSIDLLKNDTDADAADFLTIDAATVLSGNAIVSIANDGELLVQDLNTQLVAGQKATVTIEYTVSDGFETDTGLVTIDITGTTDEGDQVRGTENADRYEGFDFDDFYFALGGNDVINGRDGDDFLVGGNGKDRINGGDGHDTIVGGTGDDRLYGSWGTDTFSFSPGDGRDIISIRESSGRSHDILDLSDFGFRNFNQVKRMTEVSDFDLIIDLPGRDRIKIDGGAYFGIDVII